MLIITILLIIIAFGVLQLSEGGRKCLNIVGSLIGIGILLYIGFLVLAFLYGTWINSVDEETRASVFDLIELVAILIPLILLSDFLKRKIKPYYVNWRKKFQLKHPILTKYIFTGKFHFNPGLFLASSIAFVFLGSCALVLYGIFFLK